MLHLYTAIVRPVLECACPVWHTSITNERCNRLESIQKRVVYIVNGLTKDYTEFFIDNNLLSLYAHRCDLSKRFLKNNVLTSSSCLHYLLPDLRENDFVAKLRNASVYSLPLVRTARCKHSFMAVEHYTWICFEFHLYCMF